MLLHSSHPHSFTLIDEIPSEMLGISHLYLHSKGFFWGEVKHPICSNPRPFTSLVAEETMASWMATTNTCEVHSGDVEIQCTNRAPKKVSAWGADPFLWKMALVQEERKRGLDLIAWKWWCCHMKEAVLCHFHGFSHSHIVLPRSVSVRIWISSKVLSSRFNSLTGRFSILLNARALANKHCCTSGSSDSFLEFPLRCRKMVHFQRHSQRLGGESMEWCLFVRPSICRSVGLSVCLWVCTYVFGYACIHA